VPSPKLPGVPKVNPTRSLDQIRERALREATEALEQLDARATEQRAELRKTEADLERAKELIQALGSKQRDQLPPLPDAALIGPASGANPFDGPGTVSPPEPSASPFDRDRPGTTPPPDNEVSIPPPDTDPFGRPVLATPSTRIDPFAGAGAGDGPVIPAANVSNQERRLREMERKLDLILKMIDGTRRRESPQSVPLP
jgi:hypothetical protein